MWNGSTGEETGRAHAAVERRDLIAANEKHKRDAPRGLCDESEACPKMRKPRTSSRLSSLQKGGGIDLNTCPDRQETVRKGQAQWAKTAKDAMGEWTARWDVDAAYIEGGQKTSIYWDEIEAGGEMGA